MSVYKKISDDCRTFNSESDFLKYYEKNKETIDEINTRALNLKFKINGYKIGRKEGKIILYPINNVSKIDIEEGFVPVAIHPQNIICYDLNRSLEESLNNDDGRLWIINLDIDYFFNNKSQMFSSEYINSVCDQINRVKEKIAVVTIALSPECCGGWDNSIKVYNQIAGQLSIDMRL